MTNEKAINVLRGQESAYWDTLTEAEHKAFDLAVDALTAKQPRVIPLKELADEANHCFDVVWHEVKGGNVVPRRVQPCGHMLKVKSFYTEPFLSDGATYNLTWRCWTARPTDEQREATPWDEPPKEET